MATGIHRNGVEREQDAPAQLAPTVIYLLDANDDSRLKVRQWIHDHLAASALQEFDSYQRAGLALERTQPALLIVDIGLREGNGMEFLRKTRLAYPDIRILVWTRQDETIYAERALRIGAHGYIMKNAAADDFTTALQTVLRGDLYVSPRIEDKLMRNIARQHEGDVLDPERLLSNRELEVFVKIGSGFSSRDIAAQLALSIKTVETHRAHIKRKLNLRSARDLTEQAEEWAGHTFA
jgi:DNA-binding NarL/FixJ family response regulator